MKKFILYGELAKRFGKHHQFKVKSVHEGIRALKANFKGFEEMLCGSHVYGIGYRVKVGSRSLDEASDTIIPSSDRDTIRIVPVLFGSGGGIFRVILGAALVVGGILVSGLTFGAAGPLGQGMIVSGLGLVIGGVAQLLTGPPKIDAQADSAEKKQSYIFNGPVNTTAQGGAIPVGYGRMIVGSVTVSAGIETHES